MKAKQKQLKNTSRARKVITKPALARQKVRRHAKKILVPHKENEYRPHLIRVHGLTAVLVIALVAQMVYGLATTGDFKVLGRASDVSITELLNSTNDVRKDNGLGELVSNDKLNQAAQLKAQNMFNEQYWAHTSPSGTEPWKWVTEAGYAYSAAGENLAKNYPNAEATVEAWLGSETHRANVLNGRYEDVGFAVLDGKLQGYETTLVVALYGAPEKVSALPINANQAGTTFSAAAVAGDATSPVSYFASAVQALSPVTIAVLGIFAVVAIVGVAAHHYRNKLPKAWRQSWKVHHGMYTFIGMLALGVLIIIATGGGSI